MLLLIYWQPLKSFLKLSSNSNLTSGTLWAFILGALSPVSHHSLCNMHNAIKITMYVQGPQWMNPYDLIMLLLAPPRGRTLHFFLLMEGSTINTTMGRSFVLNRSLWRHYRASSFCSWLGFTNTLRRLTTVQLLDTEMHFLSSHHWQPRVLAVQLAQSENRKHCSSVLSGRGRTNQTKISFVIAKWYFSLNTLISALHIRKNMWWVVHLAYPQV